LSSIIPVAAIPAGGELCLNSFLTAGADPVVFSFFSIFQRPAKDVFSLWEVRIVRDPYLGPALVGREFSRSAGKKLIAPHAGNALRLQQAMEVIDKQTVLGTVYALHEGGISMGTRR
jgi:hypothetical protein